MDSIISLLKDTPIPTILVVSGVVFLFLALAGQIAGKLEVPPARQKWAAAVGAVFLGAGLLLYLSPGMPRSTLAESAQPSREVAVADQAQAPQIQQGGQSVQGLQDSHSSPEAPADTSPTTPGVTAETAPVGAEECLQGVFSGIAADRVVQVESGKSGKELLGAHQSKKEPAGIVVLDLGTPVLALTYIFVEEDQLFKIGKIVDSACQPVVYANASRGGPREVLENWDTLEATISPTIYTLRFGYYGGVVSLDSSEFQR